MAPIRALNFRAVCTVLLCTFWISLPVHVLASGESSPDHDHDHGHSSLIFGDPFEEIIGHLGEIATAVTERNITHEETVGLLDSLFDERMQCTEFFNGTKCLECLSADSLFSIVGVQSAHGLDEEHFNRACVVLLHYVTNLDSACADGALASQTYAYFAWELQTGLDSTANVSEEELETMMDRVAISYAADNFAKCFDVETVFEAAVDDHDAGADEHELENVAAIVISSLLRGFCIGNATEIHPDAFLDDIFDTYGTDGVISEEEFIEILEILSIGGEVASGSPDGHDGHDHERRRRSTRDIGAHILAGRSERRRRRNAESDHGHDEHGSGGSLDVHSCFSVDDLLEMVHANHSVGLTRDQFKALSPVLIQQAISEACLHGDETSRTTGPSPAEVWGYGMLAVFIISLCALAGVAFLPCLNSTVYGLVLQTMVALAVATLVGDSIMHLIPQAVGLHAHDAMSAGNHGADSEELAFVWKCLVVVVAVYAFFVFESTMTMFGGAHSHSVEPDGDPTSRKRASSNLRLREAVSGSFRKSDSKAQLDMTEENDNAYERTDSSGHSGRNQKVCWGMGSLPFMILIGDGLHNFGDGLAIGAAFATSLGAGLSTSVAVFCHELPHELGDFAVLLNAGLSFRKAICFNVLSAMMAFIGLCIGIPLAANQEARQWIFAVAAGMFLYVALVDMLPEIIHHDLKKKRIVFLLHNIGFLTGTAIILVIALYEDSIIFSI